MAKQSTPDERRNFILQRLHEQGRLTTAELSEHFEISDDSARRDFRELAAEGLIQRIHGAALPVSSAAMPFAARYKIAETVKDRLAQFAAGFVKSGQVVLFDGGTTNLAITKHIAPSLEFTAITNSPPLAAALSNHANVRIILIGGVLDKRSQMTTGARVLDDIARLRADLCFFGMHSISRDAGLTTADFDEAVLKRTMVDASTDVIAVATRDKIGTVAPFQVCELGRLHVLVTEPNAGEDELQAYRQAGIDVQVI